MEKVESESEGFDTQRKTMITDYITAPSRKVHYELFEKTFKYLIDNVIFSANTVEGRAGSPYNFIQPEKLLKEFDFSLGNEGTDMGTLFKSFDVVVKHTPKYPHPYKVSGEGSGINPYALAGDLLATTMNSVVLTYMYAPVFTLMEHILFGRLRRIAGYPDPEHTGDGVVVADSYVGDAMAIIIGLHHKFRLVRHQGLTHLKSKPIFFHGKHSEYTKITNFLRLETSCCVTVKSDKNGRMSIPDLRKKIDAALKRGDTPFMVIGVAGSKTLGTVDPLDKIGGICKEYDLWFHISTGIGGASLFSKKYAVNLKGFELSDSFTFASDIISSTPFSSATLICRKDNVLNNSFALDSPIVFAETDLYDIKWNTGDRTIQTSRRPEVLKVWFKWKALGEIRIGQQADHGHRSAEFFAEEAARREGAFRMLISNIDTPLIGFYYIPYDLRPYSSDPDFTITYKTRLSSITLEIKNELVTQGVMHLGTSIWRKFPTHLIIALNNSAITKDDIIYMLDQIEYVGSKISGDPDIGEKPITPRRPSKFPPYVSAPIESMHKRFFEDIFKIFQTSGLYFNEPGQDVPPLLFKEPESLLAAFDFGLGPNPTSHEDLLKLTQEIIKYSGHQSHALYVYQLKAGLEPYSIMADYLQMSMTSSSTSYEEGPVYTLMENEVVRATRELVGYPDTGFDDGIVVPGGSLANIYAQRVALYGAQTNNTWDMAGAKRYVMFISDQAHYCHEKGANIDGIGQDYCQLVETNDRHQMIPSALVKWIEYHLKSGGTPFLVVATMGTTIMGAIDPIGEIVDICDKYGLWLHVDGSFGGGIIFSEKELSRKKGLKRALTGTDSFCFNAHKMLCVPTTVSVVVFREKGVLRKAFTTPGKDEYDSGTLYDSDVWDNSKKRLQRAQRGEVYKLWTTWKTKGVKGIARHIERSFDNKRFAVEEFGRRNDKFHLVIPDYELVCVCFHYLPTVLRGMEPMTEKEKTEFNGRLQNVGYQLQDRIVKANKFIFVLEEDKFNPVYIKINFISSALQPDGVKTMLDLMDEYGHDIMV